MNILSHIAIACIRAYQICVSPWLGANCRFQPSCSAYATEALATHGAVKGGWLATKRICRCHPFAADGFDPVPEKHSHKKVATPHA